jgi:NAD-dependent dihydropyrimidine dehydrogenase PreA subunit
MFVDQDKCIQCQMCIPYCPMEAIAYNEETGRVEIDQEACVECEICRNSNCPTDALTMPELEWPRVLRQRFSNPLITHPNTNVPGRGTEEMKTNEVTGRFKRGRVGVAIEMGRPGTGVKFSDVEKVAMAVASAGDVNFEPQNPVTGLMSDVKTGKLRDDVLEVRSLSAIIEFEIPNEKLATVLEKLQEVTPEINTVYSLDLCTRVNEDGTVPILEVVKEAGYTPYSNGKTNVGLGRPLAKEE